MYCTVCLGVYLLPYYRLVDQRFSAMPRTCIISSTLHHEGLAASCMSLPTMWCTTMGRLGGTPWERK